MEHLFAPWRMTYIMHGIKTDGCLFCTLLGQEDGPENLILHRGERAFIVLNRYPYTNGHLMVVPFEHESSLEDLPQETLSEMILLSTRAMTLLRRAYNAQGFNLGGNIGAVAGAGVEEHVHLHIVPRWLGDTNFMATTAQTRVLPEALTTTYELLHRLWQEMEDERS